MTAPIAELHGLSIRFGATEAVAGVSLALHPGRTLGLVGESGSGKSLTALALAGLLPPAARASGRIRLFGQEMQAAPERAWRALRGARIAMVFQEPMASLNPSMRIGQQVDETLRAHTPLPRAARHARTLALLDEVGLPDPEARAAAFPHQLSGGQQQRAMLAIALAADPDILLADEPTTALDTTVQAQILALLARLQQSRGLAMLFVSHDLAVVAGIAHEVAVMRAGRIVEHGETARLFAAPSHPYTATLLASRPRPMPTPAVGSGSIPALEARDLAVTFRPHRRGSAPVQALAGISLTLPEGASLGLVGESGSGKSTLARAAVGLVAPTSGTIRVFGQDPTAPPDRRAQARRAQMVFQDAAGSLNPRLTVAEILAEPLAVHALCPPATRRDRAAALLSEVGLQPAHLGRYPHQLSGGQRQRVAIARALAVDPRLLVCDEPVSALDMTVQCQVLELLARIRRARSLTLLFIGHDLAAVAAVCERIVVVRNGTIVEDGPSPQVMGSPRTPYARALVAAMPRRPADPLRAASAPASLQGAPAAG
jgi:ABC-type glutathione transport system ATPase component